MQQNFLTVFGLVVGLTAWTSAGHYAQAANDNYYTRYDNYVENIDQKLDNFAERRYQKELSIARAIEKRAYEEALALQQAQELAMQQAAERVRIATQKAQQKRQRAIAIQREKERQDIAAHNAIIDARKTAIQLLAQSGGDISKYSNIPRNTTFIPVNNSNVPSAAPQVDIVAAQRRQANAQAEQNRILEQQRQATLAAAQAKKVAAAKKKKKKKSRRSRAS